MSEHIPGNPSQNDGPVGGKSRTDEPNATKEQPAPEWQQVSFLPQDALPLAQAGVVHGTLTHVLQSAEAQKPVVDASPQETIVIVRPRPEPVLKAIHLDPSMAGGELESEKNDLIMLEERLHEERLHVNPLGVHVREGATTAVGAGDEVTAEEETEELGLRMSDETDNKVP